MLNLSDLRVGEQAIVQGFTEGCLCYRQKLLAMGLTKGACFTVIRKAPLGCPVAIKTRDCILTLRQTEANCIVIARRELCVS